MTKSRIALIALAVCCIAVLSAGTVARIVLQETAYNVITTSGVDVTIHEKTEDGADPDTPLEELPDWEDRFDVLPGMSFSKIAFVENTGAEPVYVRVRLHEKIVDKDDQELPTDVLHMTVDTEGWLTKPGEEWYYYEAQLTSGQKSPTLLRSVKFDEKMGNEYQGATATVVVEVQVVQAKHNSEDVLTAAGWPASTVK